MQPLTKEIDGEIHLSMAAIFVMTADAARGLALMRELLSAARSGGYTQTDIAETVLTQGNNQRAIEIAQTVCKLISPDAMQDAFERAGFYLPS